MKIAFYMRVSKDDLSQTPENQEVPLIKLAESYSGTIVKKYVDYASGGNSNRPQFVQMLKDAKNREFDTIFVWSLDRFSREGISHTLSYLEQLKRSGVALKSLQESWLDISDEGIGQVIISLLAWVAKNERKRISERTKAGLARAKKEGKLKPRGKDRGRRRTSGYVNYWLKKRDKVAISL